MGWLSNGSDKPKTAEEREYVRLADWYDQPGSKTGPRIDPPERAGREPGRPSLRRARPRAGCVMAKHRDNTIDDKTWNAYNNGRARAMEKMPKEIFDKHLTTHKQVEAAKQGRN